MRYLWIVLLLAGCAKPVSVCGPFPIVQVSPEEQGKQLEAGKYQALLGKVVSFPMSAEKSGEFKDEKATATLNLPSLLCILNEHGKAYGESK